jgi:hypothetical protein
VAKPLIFHFGDGDLPFAMSKVDRHDLYGYVDVETVDESGRKCMLATLADDGRTVIGSGGTAITCLSVEGNWLERGKLVPTDVDGNAMTPVASSFSAAVPLEKTATIDEYLSHNIRSVYQLSCEGDASALIARLKSGAIFTFPYSYRGGLEPDVGFLLMAAEGNVFLAVGSATKLEFVGFDQAGGVEEETSADEADDEIDFSMM